jgi:hypothetical protein
VAYVGVSGDGHIGRWNSTASVYAALGHDERNPLAQRRSRSAPGFAAAEGLARLQLGALRLSALLQSADRDPFDGKADGIRRDPREPAVRRRRHELLGPPGRAARGRGRRRALGPQRRAREPALVEGPGAGELREPGLALLGIGADADVLPQLRVIGNLNYLSFLEHTVLGVLRNQAPPAKSIGWDVSAAVQWRPFMTQNIVVNASAAALLPGKGLKQLYDEDRRGPQYSMLVNVSPLFEPGKNETQRPPRPQRMQD